MTNLDQYILDHRAELDQVEGPENEAMLWDQISNDLSAKAPSTGKTKVISLFDNRYIQWAIAASVGLFIGLSTWVFIPASNGNVRTNHLSLTKYAPEFAEREQGYIQLIAQKQSEIEFQDINQNEYIDLFRELESLELLRQEYLKDSEQAVGNEQFIQTLIRFYERKINLLERLSHEIQKKNKHERRKEMQI